MFQYQKWDYLADVLEKVNKNQFGQFYKYNMENQYHDHNTDLGEPPPPEKNPLFMELVPLR